LKDLATVTHGRRLLYTVSQKRGVELFAMTSLTVNRFWQVFQCWKQRWISCKI